MSLNEYLEFKRLKAENQQMRCTLAMIAEMNITDSSGKEVPEDTLHEVRKLATRANQQSKESA